MSTSSLPAASRYELLLRLAAGGTATVYVGRLRGAAGFSRLVAVKRAHQHLVEDPSFRATMLREARIASQLRHPNVVSVVDVEEVDSELLLIMDYVEGASLAALVSPPATDLLAAARATLRIALDACAGLDAAHRAVDERGRPLGLVHRDVSPQNILVGVDGVGRLIDFGIAKVSSLRSGHTGLSLLKGKLPYMAPEYLRGEPLDPRSDVFGAGVVLWEALTGRRLFRAANEFDTLKRILELEAPPASRYVPGLPPEIDRAVARALAKARDERFESARAFGDAVEGAARAAGLLATHAEVSDLVTQRAGEAIAKVREALLKFAGPPLDEEPSSSIAIELEGQGAGRGERPTVTASRPSGALDDAARPAAITNTTGELARALLRRPGGWRQGAVASAVVAFALGAALVFGAVTGRERRRPATESPDAREAAALTPGESPAPPPPEPPPPPPPDDATPGERDAGGNDAAPEASGARPQGPATRPPPRHGGGGRPSTGRPPAPPPPPKPTVERKPPQPTPPPNPYTKGGH
jgi:serine/threonine-protein kinase